MDSLRSKHSAHSVLEGVLLDAGGDLKAAAITLAGMVVALRDGFSPGYSRLPLTPSREQP